MELPRFKRFLGVTCPTCVSSLFKMKQAGDDRVSQESSSDYREGPDGTSGNMVEQPASCSYDRGAAPAGNAYNMDDLQVIDMNSADEVRRMAKAALRSGNDQTFRYGVDPVEASEAPEEGPGMLQTLYRLAAPKGTTPNNTTNKPKASDTTQKKEKIGQGASKKRKQKSKFVNSFKRRASVSKFYTGRLSNLMRDLASKSTK